MPSTDYLNRLARLLVVREADVQDVARLLGTRRKDYTIAVARLDGAADAVYRVVDGWGPQQVLAMVKEAVGEVPSYTAQGRRDWFNRKTLAVEAGLQYIQRSA